MHESMSSEQERNGKEELVIIELCLTSCVNTFNCTVTGWSFDKNQNRVPKQLEGFKKDWTCAYKKHWEHASNSNICSLMTGISRPVFAQVTVLNKKVLNKKGT